MAKRQRSRRKRHSQGLGKADLASDMEEYIKSRVSASGADECWEYTGYRTLGGYGQVSNPGVPGAQNVVLAHRAAYVLWVGEIPPRTCVMHTCDNPPCCNPAHLQLASHRENMIDKSIKLRGNVNVLTPEDVKKIRAAYDLLGFVPVELYKELGVSKQTAENAAEGRSWSWLK